MGIICETCGRDIDALGQDNMGVGAPLCEDCWGEQQRRAAETLREVRNLRFENARLREKLDAVMTEETAVQNLRKGIETAYEPNRERALALTKLDECELWLGRCELKETATPAAGSSAQEAAMPCLKDVRVEVKPEALAEQVTRSLLDGAVPMLRMAVE